MGRREEGNGVGEWSEGMGGEGGAVTKALSFCIMQTIDAVLQNH